MSKTLLATIASGAAAAALLFITIAEFPGQDHRNALPQADSLHGQSVNLSSSAETAPQRGTADAVLASEARLEAIESALTKLKSGQESLQREQRRLNHLLSKSTILAQPQLPAENQAAADDGTLEDELDAAADDAYAKEQRLMALEEAMNAQTSDPSWDDSAAKILLETAQASNAAGSHVEGVSCKGSMCRVDVMHEDEQAMQDYFAGDAELVPWGNKGRLETVEDGTGALLTYIYITREGYDFPNIP